MIYIMQLSMRGCIIKKSISYTVVAKSVLCSLFKHVINDVFKKTKQYTPHI